MSIARSVGLHYLADGSHLAKDHSFGQHWSNWSKTLEVDESTNITECKRLFVNVCRCNGLVSMAMECLNLGQGGKKASIF